MITSQKVSSVRNVGTPNTHKLCSLCGESWRDGQRMHCRHCGTLNFIYRKYGTGQSDALRAVKREIREGRLCPPTEFACVDCGKPATAYEHRDYNLPLDVVPTCRPCNAKRGYAIPKRMTFDEFMAQVKRTHFIKGQWPIPLEAFEVIRLKYFKEQA